MAQQLLNSTENIGIAHGISAWFQKDYTGSWRELGDCAISGINLAPEFSEHNSSRNGLRALRKKILTKKSASVAITLNEPNILNLQRVLYGGTVDADEDDVTVHDGRIMTLETSDAELAVDFSDIGESDFASITVTAVYALDDVLYADNLISVDKTPNAVSGVCKLGTSPLGGDSTGPLEGDEVYVQYQVSVDNMMSTEMFGAADLTLEGSAQLQVRNMNGGVIQVWSFNSVQLSASGDIAIPVDAIQTLPLTMALLERDGSFGKVYAK